MSARSYRVFATASIGNDAEQMLRDRGYELEVYPNVEAPPKELILDKVKTGVDGLITTLRDKIDAEVFEAGKGTLKVVAQIAVGFDNINRADANRYAAEQLQHSFLNGYESEVPIYKDFAVSDELLRHRDVVFVGRPEANSALALWSARLGLDYQGASFRINGEVHASEREGLILATDNPLDSTHMVLVVAGNDALSTVKAQGTDLTTSEYTVFRDGDAAVKGFLTPNVPRRSAQAGN